MKILDNLFTVEEIKKIYNHYRAYPYKRIEVDGPGLPYTGLSCNLDLNDEIVKLIIEKTNTEKDNLLRAYINLFLKIVSENIPYKTLYLTPFVTSLTSCISLEL